MFTQMLTYTSRPVQTSASHTSRLVPDNVERARHCVTQAEKYVYLQSPDSCHESWAYHPDRNLHSSHKLCIRLCAGKNCFRHSSSKFEDPYAWPATALCNILFAKAPEVLAVSIRHNNILAHLHTTMRLSTLCEETVLKFFDNLGIDCVCTLCLVKSTLPNLPLVDAKQHQSQTSQDPLDTSCVQAHGGTEFCGPAVPFPVPY